MAAPEPRYHVGISGSYGGWNIGDEAILEGIVKELRRTGPVSITVFSRDPDDTLQRHGVERALSASSLSREELSAEIAAFDALIIGGGGILFDDMAEVFVREALIAQEVGVPVVVYAVSVGPLENQTTRKRLLGALEHADVVTVRDTQSRTLLERIGVKRDVVVTADPALLMEPAPLPPAAVEGEGMDRRRPLIGMSVREVGAAAPDLDETHYHQLLADAADYMIYRYDAQLLFFPMERRVLDLQQSHAVIAKMARADHASVLKHEYTAGQVLSLVGKLDFAIGMRLHFLIFSALCNVPFVPLSYAGKVSGFLEKFDITVPPVQHTQAGQLIARIDRSWDERRQFRRRINKYLPDLRERARETNRLLWEVLRRREPRQQTLPATRTAG
ncbi:MAG TPA: polysaccharide pyruvyl transferase family protein [Vicinamibacterales bacterium]